MAEIYVYGKDTKKGKFQPAQGNEEAIYEIPQGGTFGLRRPTEIAPWMQEEKYIGEIVIIRPPLITRTEPHRGLFGVRSKKVLVEIFPPEGGGLIFQDRTDPENLADLVASRREQGWSVTRELEGILIPKETQILPE